MTKNVYFLQHHSLDTLYNFAIVIVFQNKTLQFKEARLVPTYPIHGCQDIMNHDDIAGNIALSERG